ncbi:MAG: AsmA family protein [Emcibacter sp.]|nr:AsmA family protein [Emcibacter sp.]
MKKLGIGFGILITLLIGVILIVPSFLNWNEYKTQIERTASNYTGRDVKIKGDISLSLLPMTALSVNDVTMSNIQGGKAENILSLKSLDIQVSFPSALSSIFGGRVKVKKFILVDPIVAMEVLSDGRVNWILDAQIDAQNAGTAKQATTKDISLENFQIVNGQISFEDMASKQMELLRKINANVQAESIKGPFVIAGSARYKGLGVDLDLKLGKNRQGKKMPVTLALLTLDRRVSAKVIGGIMFNEKSNEKSLAFSGKLDITAGDAGDILNAFDRFTGLKNPEHLKIGQAFALDTMLEVGHDKVAVNEVNMRVGQSRAQGNGYIVLGEKVNIQAALSINKLDIDPLLPVLEDYQKNRMSEAGLRPQKGNGKAYNIVSRLSGNVDLKLGALKYNDKIASQIMLKLFAKDGVIGVSTLQARMPGGASLAFKGQITPPDAQEKTGITLIGDMVVKASNLRGMLDWLKLDTADIPTGQLTQFSYKSGLKVTSDLLQLYEIDGKLDAIHYQGGLSYAIAPRPSYGINLNLKNLNLDSYVIKEKRSENKKSTETIDLKKIFAQLSEFDANYTIGLSNMTAGGFKIRSGQLNGVLLGGNLDAKTINFKDLAGVNIKASAQGANFGSKPEITLALSADAKSLAGLQRNIKRDYFIDLRKLGEMKLAASLSSTLEKMDVDIKSHFGVKKLNVAGTIRSATLKKFPEIGSSNLDIDLQSTSLAALVDQLDLGMAKPRAADDRPIRLRSRIKTSSNIVDIDGKINIAAGEILIIGRKKGHGKAGTVDLALDFKGEETREFIRGLGLNFKPAKKKLGPLMLKMNVAGVGDQYVIKNIVGDMGPVKLSGSGKLNMALENPAFDFNIKAGDIPLHDFLERSDHGSKAYGQWSKSTMDLSLFSEYEGNVRISAGSLTYNKYIFENPAFDANLKDGLLSVNNFTGRLFGGDVALSGSFGGANKPKMALNMTLKKASLSAATASSAGIAPVTGFFDMSGQFTGEGRSQYDMMSSLAGTGNIIASSGMIRGIDIPGLSRQLSDMTSEGAFLKLLGSALSGGQTPYKGGKSNLVVKDGKIEFSPFDIELDGAKSNVRMAVDLLTWTIRSDGWIGLVDHPGAPPIDVSVRGDISSPRITYKTDRLTKFVGAKIASNLLQQLIGKEGGLEGIFGNQPKEEAPPAADPDQKPKPAEDFGKRMLEKLFEKKTPDDKDKKPEKP